MDFVLLAGRILLALVFAFAATSKLVNRAGIRKTIAEFGVPPALANPVGSQLPVAELAVAVVLLTPWAWWGAVGALVLLSAFIVAIALNLLKGRTPDCNCFGQIRSKPIGWGTVARNCALAVCAGVIVWVGPSHANVNAVSGLAGGLQMSTFALVIAAGMLAALAAETVLLWQLFRQHGRLLLRMDQLEQRLAVPASPVQIGLPMGTVAPSFVLTTQTRKTLGLAALLRAGTPALLIFSDPNCQPCSTLLPEIKQWQHQYAETVRIAVVSRGAEDANRLLAQRFGLKDVLIQTGSEVADAYQVTGTPAAVFIRADGTIGHEVALGRDAILDLVKVASQSSIVAVRSSESEHAVLSYGTATR
jgi:peroxiredoxin